MSQKVITDQTFNGTVQIDNKHFINCSFENCTLEWSGKDASETGCTFKKSRFVLNGEALRFHVTLQRFGLDLNAPILTIGESIQNAPME